MKNFTRVLLAGLILAVTFVTFLPSLNNGFINWDDDSYVIENPIIKNHSFENIKRMFTSVFLANYHPVTLLSYLLDYRLFELNPFGYHLTNFILHLINCFFVFWLFYILTRKPAVAFITSLLFAIHPMHVESVAWISERKDVLYSVFFLAAVICYYYYRRQGRAGKYYYVSLIFFILALFSKAMAVTLPAVLLLVDYLLCRKKDKFVFIDKIPFFVLSSIFGIVAIRAQSMHGGIITEGQFNLLDKVGVGCYCVIFYIVKIIFPFNLSCLYPYIKIPNNFFSSVYFFSLLACIILTLLVFYSGRYTRKIVFGGGLFLAAISPVLQFVPIGYAIVADRYVYIASLGVFYIVAEGVIWVYSKKVKHSRFLQAVMRLTAIILISVLVSATRERCNVWEDGIALWSDVLEKYPYVTIAYNNRGAALLEKEEYGKAYSDFISAIRLDPAHYGAYFNLSRLYYYKGAFGEAIKLIRKSLQLKPDYLKAYDFLAAIYGQLGKHGEVINICKKVLQINSGHVPAYINLCRAYGNTGNFTQAVISCRNAVKIDPNSEAAYFNLSAAYFYLKQFDLAVKYCDKAIALGYKVPPEYLNEMLPFRSE